MRNRIRCGLTWLVSLLTVVSLHIATVVWFATSPTCAQGLQSTPATGKYLLRKKFSVNDSWAYKIAETMTLSADAGGFPFPFVPSQLSIAYHVFEKVTAVYPDGRAVIRCTVEFSPDSVLGMPACVFDKELNTRGEILQMKLVSGISPILLPTDIVFPENAVGVGSSWRVKVSIPGFPGVEHEATYTLEEVRLQGDTWVARISFKDKQSSGQERLQFLELPVTVSGNFQQQGSLVVDVATGKVNSADVSAIASIRGVAGKDMTGGVQMSFRSTARLAYQSQEQPRPQGVARQELNRLIEAGLLKTLMNYPYQVPQHWMIDTAHVVDGKYLPGTPLDPAIDAALRRRAPDFGLTNSLHHGQMWTLVLVEAAIIACELEFAQDDYLEALLEAAERSEQTIAVAGAVVSLLPVKDAFGNTKIRVSVTKQVNQMARDFLVSEGVFKGKRATFRAVHRYAFKRLVDCFDNLYDNLSSLFGVVESLHVLLSPIELEIIMRQAAVEEVLHQWCSFIRSQPLVYRDQALEKIVYQITSDEYSQVVEWLLIALAFREDKTLLDQIGSGATIWEGAARLAKTQPGKQITVKVKGALRDIKFTPKGWAKMLNIPPKWMKGVANVVKIWTPVAKLLSKVIPRIVMFYDAAEMAEEVWDYPLGVEAATLAYSLADWLTKRPLSDSTAEELALYMLMVGDAHMKGYFEANLFYAGANLYAGTYLPGGKALQDKWKSVLHSSERTAALQGAVEKVWVGKQPQSDRPHKGTIQGTR